MRVLMLTQWFDPEPIFKGIALARMLVERGHEVEVLTGFPNYPGGRLYPGYRLGMWQRETREGISIVRVPLYPSHDRSAIRRALNYLSFAAAAAVLGPALLRRPDVIYVFHPPATVALPALLLRRWFSVPVVYDVQDLWPDTLASTGMLDNRRILGMLAGACRFAYRQMDRVVVPSPGFRITLLDRGVEPDRIDLIHNWAPPSDEGPPVETRPEPFTVAFAGNLGMAQGLDAVLDAAALCAGTSPPVRFLLVGGGVEEERLRQRALALTNVEFTGRLPLAEAQAVLRKADALLVHLKDDPLFAITIPSKTQAYLAAGRPIVMAVRGDAADLIRESGAGVVAEPENAAGIAAAIRQVAALPASERARMGRAGREFYSQHLSIGRAVEKFEASFERALSARHSLLHARRPAAENGLDVCD